MNSKTHILHYGLNRSGTNYLKELIDKHFKVDFLNLEDDRKHPLHKHFRLYDNKSLIGRPNFRNNLQFNSFIDFENKALPDIHGAAYVVISKDPYSWHLSYSRWGAKNHWSPTPHPFILEYNEFYKKWLEFSGQTDRIAFVRYIDLLQKPGEVLSELQFKFNLQNSIDIGKDVRIKKVPMSRKFSNKRLRYYLDEKYLEEFSTEELSALNSQVDHELLKNLGYESRP